MIAERRTAIAQPAGKAFRDQCGLRTIHHIVRHERHHDRQENDGCNAGVQQAEIDETEHAGHDRADHVHVLASDAVGEMAEEWYAEERQNGGCKDGGEQEVTRDGQAADPVGEDEGSEDVERRLFTHAGEGGKYDLLRVALDHFQYRRALDLALGQQFGEDRRLENAEPDIKPDPDEDEAQEERYAPAPGEELLAG